MGKRGHSALDEAGSSESNLVVGGFPLEDPHAGKQLPGAGWRFTRQSLFPPVSTGWYKSYRYHRAPFISRALLIAAIALQLSWLSAYRGRSGAQVERSA